MGKQTGIILEKLLQIYTEQSCFCQALLFKQLTINDLTRWILKDEFRTD